MDLKRFAQLQKQDLDLVNTKSADYSNDNIHQTGMSGVLTRIVDKVVRARNLIGNAEKGLGVNYESLEDTFRDLSNYGVIGRMVLEGSWKPTTALVYLAGPIDNVTELDASAWRKKATEVLGKYGVSVFNPVSAFTVASSHVAAHVVEINKRAIDICDVMLAYVPVTGGAFQTIREIEYARSSGKRVLLVSPGNQSLGTFDCECFNLLRDALENIVGQPVTFLDRTEGAA